MLIMLSSRIRVPNLLFNRGIQSNAELVENCKVINNRNPRNLERLRIGRKREGYHLENPSDPYWHRLTLTPSNQYVSAAVCHFQNGPIISASTKEWALKLQLYRCIDVSAYANLGRVLARRCLEAGICEMQVDPPMKKCGKTLVFLEEVKKMGVILEESERYRHPAPWDYKRPAKSWEYYE